MYGPLSSNTQAILLLTAPLIAGRNTPSDDLLSPGEYKKLAVLLRSIQRQPADLLNKDSADVISECREVVEADRLLRLLDRGFLLSQAIERWQARAIWVISRADSAYPKRFKARLKEDAPSILYGCGRPEVMENGGLAVVGSRQVSDRLIRSTEELGREAASAGCTVISGGARGIDRAAMCGALEARGKVIGVLAEGLERAALNRDNRDSLLDGRLTLVSAYDPQAGFNVGHAMQRNKLIYALADAAIVMNSDYQSGGTWAGAVEQLDKLKFVPVYVRSNGESSKGLNALRERGALYWPNPTTNEAFWNAINSPTDIDNTREPKPINGTLAPTGEVATGACELCRNLQADTVKPTSGPVGSAGSACEELYSKVREISLRLTKAITEEEFAAHLGVSKGQAKEWLKQLVEEGTMERLTKPLRYIPSSRHSLLR